VSAGQDGARLALAFASGRVAQRPAVKTTRSPVWGWVPRWLQTT
jgi:hypothetical protein